MQKLWSKDPNPRNGFSAISRGSKKAGEFKVHLVAFCSWGLLRVSFGSLF